MIKKIIEHLIKGLVENPSEVLVTENRDADGAVLLCVKVRAEDKGRLIGKDGKTIKAIRLLAGLSSSHDRDKKLSVEVAEQ